MRCTALLTLSAVLIVAAGVPARAEVRFGRNVFIGGHDFSHQTYNRKRRLVVHLSQRPPRREGCDWRTNGDGGRVRTCRLRQRGHR